MSKHQPMRQALCLLFICLISSSSVLFVFAQEVDPNLDSDGDGLTDWDEENRYWSNPNEGDTDGDTIDDGREVETGTSPISADSDGDFISDTYEYTHWNPLAEDLDDRYKFCPYIADLSHLTLEVEDDRVVNHFEFMKGNVTKTEDTTTVVDQTQDLHNWGDSTTNDLDLYAGGWMKRGFMSQDLGIMDFSFAMVQPYIEILGEAGISYHSNTVDYDSTDHTTLDLTDNTIADTYEEYVEKGWDLSAATLTAEVSVTNTFDRTVRVESAIFDLIIGGITYHSSAWDLPDLTFGQGESHTYTISWDMAGESWIIDLTTGNARLAINANSIEQSVWDEEGRDWVAQDVVREYVQTACVLVEIDSGGIEVHSFVTANVDKLDGTNVLRVLDLLFLDYTFRYGRLIDLMGVRSKPGEEVWSFAYWDRWYDVDSLSEELNFEELRMWGRGSLTLDLQKDTDGDWLGDGAEIHFGTNVTDTDSDHDYADDYVELVLMRSDPWNEDTDGGGTIDGIEYFEGLDPNDPLDDRLELPNWYKNHPTVQAAQAAADLLLERAVSPTSYEMTWPASQSPAENITHDYAGIVTYVMNTTWGMIGDDTIECIDIGDADGDGDMDVVVGTAPSGLLLIFENDTTVTPSVFTNTKTFTIGADYGVVSPVHVSDVVIGKTESSGDQVIMAGTWYFDGGFKGDVLVFDKGVSGLWNQLSNLNTQDIIGGVNSLAVGQIGDTGAHCIAVGQGGVDNLNYCNVTVYLDGAWESEPAAVTNQSRAVVAIGDYTNTYSGNEIIYCTYSTNSTLGYIGYRSSAYADPGFHNVIINASLMVGVGHSPPYSRFMHVAMGNLTGSGDEDLMVAIESDVTDDSSIAVYPSGTNIITGMEFVGDEFIFDDFDNDGIDEIAYVNTTSTTFPDASLMIYELNKTGPFTWEEVYTRVESTKETYVSAMTTGDMDGDGDIELFYGTDGNGWLMLWDRPEGALWQSQMQSWDVHVTLPEPWIYEGEKFPVTVTAENFGDYPIDDLMVKATHHQLVANFTDSEQIVSRVTAGGSETITFMLWPMTYGNYTFGIKLDSVDPRVSHASTYSILVKPRMAEQARIGQALLDLAEVTGNETLLDAAIKVGNWFDTVKVDGPTFYGWNGDANSTDILLPGHITSTIEATRFLLDLFRATDEMKYLLLALGGGRYMSDSLIETQPQHLTFSLLDHALAEVAGAGEYLLDLNQELLFDLYTPTIKGLANYLCLNEADYFASPGLAYDVAHFLARIPTEVTDLYDYPAYAEAIGDMFASQDVSWFEELSPSIRPDDPYDFYEIAGLAGVGMTLADLRDTLELDYAATLQLIAEEIVDDSYLTGQGRNWNEATWTVDVDDLVTSVSWEYGAAGVNVALGEVYKKTGNQTFLESMQEAVTWMGNCIPVIGDMSVPGGECELALADAIESLLYVYSITPVIFVGYFVDPMTSLSGQTFTLSGYVQTLGYYAHDVNLTAPTQEWYILDAPQTEMIEVGTIAEPSVVVVEWDVTLLLHGIFNITVEGESSNAGDQTNIAEVVVTDLGVNKVGWSGTLAQKGVSLRVAKQLPLEELHNLGEGVLLPIEALYENGEPAYNASIQVADQGLAVVNGSGLGYIAVTEFEPGSHDYPITISYDKLSGITEGTSSITISLTFTSLEIPTAAVSATSAQTGDLVTFTGRVLYSHNSNPVGGATVALDGELKATTDADGYFTFTHTETTEGLMNHTVSATADGSNRIKVSSLDQILQIEWRGFWTPTTMAVVIGAGVAGLVALIVVIIRMRRPK